MGYCPNPEKMMQVFESWKLRWGSLNWLVKLSLNIDGDKAHVLYSADEDKAQKSLQAFHNVQAYLSRLEYP